MNHWEILGAESDRGYVNFIDSLHACSVEVIVIQRPMFIIFIPVKIWLLDEVYNILEVNVIEEAISVVDGMMRSTLYPKGQLK